VPRNSEDTPAPQRQATGRRIRQLQATVMGLRKGAAPCSRRSHGGGGVSSRNPCLHTTRPSGRVSCGGSAKRISEGRRANTAKRGNLLGGGRPRSPSNTLRERGVHLTLHPLPAAGGQAREGRPPQCISGQAAAERRVVVVDTPHWGAAAASPARATAVDSCSRQQEHAPVRKTCCWGSTKACIMPKQFIFSQTLIE
jgi:hypothetical protein